MAITINTDIIDPEILADTVRGEFSQQNMVLGSILGSSGAVIINGTMPQGGPGAINQTIRVPYFGRLGRFVSNPDGQAITPSKLSQTLETAVISRASMAFEVSTWSRGLAATSGNQIDPYVEASRQIVAEAARYLDQEAITEAATSPLVRDITAETNPFISYVEVIKARSEFRDEQDNIVAMGIHSRTLNDLALLQDTTGRPLLLESNEGQNSVLRFGGIPLVISDKAPTTGNMGAVTATGTAPPTATLGGAPLGPWDLVIECLVGGPLGTATLRFSADRGQTWSNELVTAAAGVPLPLLDRAIDSTIGYNGETGVNVTFAAGPLAADNRWASTADLTVESLIFQRGAVAHWYSEANMELLFDVDILAHTSLGAMHIYQAPHLYRRRQGGTLPGVVRLRHKVRDFTG
ncbi:MAG: hypothetical protein AAGA56_19195 [Myxococcota bacterium]